MKNTKKVIDGKLTVIKPTKRKARREAQEPCGEPGIIEEAIGAIHGIVEAGKRAHAVYRKIRGK